MKITTPHGTLEGDNIEAILKEHGYDCLYDADLRYADLRGATCMVPTWAAPTCAMPTWAAPACMVPTWATPT